MKKQCGSLLVVAVLLVAVGATTAFAQSALGEFGIREADLKSRIVSALINGSIPIYPDRVKFKAASQSARAAFVREAFSVIKAHTESEAFQAEYAKQRAAAKPSAPASVSPDELYARLLEEAQNQLAELREAMANMPPDMQKQMAAAVKTLEEEYAKQTNDPQTVAMVKQMIAMQAEQKQQSYTEELDRHEERHPANPEALIVKRLRGFLELTNDIPHNAELMPGDRGVTKFVDPQFEAKSALWKRCYRAGKEPVEAARALAMEWLKQLEK